MTASLTVHPLAELIPPMTDEEYAGLRDDIAANGQAQAITLYEGQILDGRHRARACDELGIVPTTRAYSGDSPAAFVISLNVHRRSLTTSQRALIALDALPALEDEARKRMTSGAALGAERRWHGDAPVQDWTGASDDRHGTRAAAQAADLVGVSANTVAQAKRVQEQAPDLHEKVKAGELTVNAAHEQVKDRVNRSQFSPDSKPRNGRQTYREQFSLAFAGIASQMETLDPKATWTGGVMAAENVRGAAKDDEEFTGWIDSLRKARESLTRFIKALEEVK